MEKSTRKNNVGQNRGKQIMFFLLKKIFFKEMNLKKVPESYKMRQGLGVWE